MNSTTVLPLNIVRNEDFEVLDAKDILLIHELINRVYLAEDSRDADALGQCVTEDYHQQSSRYGVINSREEFVRWVLSHPEYFDGLRHQAVNIVTSKIDLNTADVLSYINVFQAFTADDDPSANLPKLIAHGVVKDRVVKKEGKWRIQKRVYDQFSILESLVTDTTVRIKASEQL